MDFNFLFVVLPKICFSTSTFQDFCFLLRFVQQLSKRDFQNFMNFCFPVNLLVAAANRLKVLKIFVSLNVTVHIQDRRKPQMPRFSNENQLVLQGQNIHEISNTKYTAIYIIQQNLAKQFTLHAAVAYSEPFPTYKQGGYLIVGNYYHKKLHLR